ncbi:tyrosine-type recombinase/integrase [Lonepinella sp. BR2357]|uniref:tyrosine-type recombinase/integrase n=1 Tax=Lonepinella sp. BR2357 TaxID=3434549 RepID=UPI003F6DC54A
MSIYKRGNIYWVDVRTPSGERIRRTAGTSNRKQAQQIHDKLKVDVLESQILTQKSERLFDDALQLFLQEGEQQKDPVSKRFLGAYWETIFKGRAMRSITGEEIEDNMPSISKRTQETLSASTKNRYRTAILRMFAIAHRRGWVDRIPYVMRNKEPKVRVRWLTQAEARNLLDNLQLDWMKDVCSFALLTGARMREILSMTWDKVDFERHIAIVSNDVAKSGRARALPLNQQAVELLRKREHHDKRKFVFHRHSDKQIDAVSWNDFHRAMERANIKNFRFHDLRHTWASWHAQAGTPLYTLKELGGWETLEMVQKYAHLNADHLLKFTEKVTIWTQ